MLRTAQQVKEEFQFAGISIADWSRENGFDPTLVYYVLKSKHIPKRGESHKVAVRLGLKKGSFQREDSFLKNSS